MNLIDDVLPWVVFLLNLVTGYSQLLPPPALLAKTIIAFRNRRRGQLRSPVRFTHPALNCVIRWAIVPGVETRIRRERLSVQSE
jgi:hypothetical protein